MADAAKPDTALAAHLQRLRQQAGGDARPAAARPERVALDELRRLIALRERAAVPRPVAAAHGPASGDLPGIEIATGLRLVEERLPMAAPAVPFDAGFARLGLHAPTSLLHFDTETTGLAGGTGTRAFMIGAADWYEGGLRVRQLLLTELRGEAAMLDCFATWVRPETVLVSYNGKCFDAPLLATRYRLSRRANPLAGLPHLDLLHPVRRRFRGVWENCRLATVEREWLRVLREDDLPGAQAPAAWLRYLRFADARDLRRVLQHNRQDTISLADLALRLAAVESTDDGDGRERTALAGDAGLPAAAGAAPAPAGRCAAAPAGADRG